MNPGIGFANRLASIIISLALAWIALLFTILGISFMPVIGILIAIPVVGFSSISFKSGVAVASESVTAARGHRAALESVLNEYVPWFEQTLKSFG